MKHLGKLAVLGAVLVASASFASADPIQLGSFCSTCTAPTGDSNTGVTLTGFVSQTFTPTAGIYPTPGTTAPTTGGSAATFNISPGNPVVWNVALANSSWVGSAATAGPKDPATNPNPVNPPQGFYTFSTTFSLGTGIYGGSLQVMADDTTEVFLAPTGGAIPTTPLIPFGTLGDDSKCANFAPTCTMDDTINLSGLTGNETLYFVVAQEGDESSSDPSGFDFDATLSATPEPNSLILLGTGLLGAAGMLVRKRRTV